MEAPATVIVLVITGLATLIAFQVPGLLEKWIFNPRAILQEKEYHRLYTCGLIHANWMHFAFNAFSFYSFARGIEMRYGPSTMLFIYGCSILGGSLLSLVIHRNHEYRALGASGGVCGIIFASIFLLPGISISMFFIPVGIPAYLYAVLFLVFSFFAHSRQVGRIGHDAHLGGAIVGLLVATALYPKLVLAEPGMFAGVLGLSLVILLALIFIPLRRRNPELREWEMPSGDERERRYLENSGRNARAEELDELLGKVSRDGMQSLSNMQRKRLEQLSKELHRRGETTDANSSRNNQ
jgi:membrane associated rhomboid family serine protease